DLRRSARCRWRRPAHGPRHVRRAHRPVTTPSAVDSTREPTTHTAGPRRPRGSRCVVAAAVLVAAACGGDDGDSTPPPPEATVGAPAVSTGDGNDTTGSGSGGFEIEVVGWSSAPYPDGVDWVGYAAGDNE